MTRPEPRSSTASSSAFSRSPVSGRTVRANKAGCLDQCEHGPTVVVYPEAVWYGHVTLGRRGRDRPAAHPRQPARAAPPDCRRMSQLRCLRTSQAFPRVEIRSCTTKRRLAFVALSCSLRVRLPHHESSPSAAVVAHPRHRQRCLPAEFWRQRPDSGRIQYRLRPENRRFAGSPDSKRTTTLLSSAPPSPTTNSLPSAPASDRFGRRCPYSCSGRDTDSPAAFLEAVARSLRSRSQPHLVSSALQRPLDQNPAK